VAIFRRKQRDGGVDFNEADSGADENAVGVGPDDDQQAAADDAAEGREDATPAFDRSHGPFDLSELDEADYEDDDEFEIDDEEDDIDDVDDLKSVTPSGDTTDERVDLGALQIPPLTGIEIRINVDQASGQGQSVSLVRGQSLVQVAAFAAPRSSGIWDEVRRDIAASLTQEGGTTDEVDGPLGRELKATLRQGNTRNQVRFVGVDGPRWFLRGVFEGPAAHDRKAAAPLEAAFRRIVVVRGNEAMAPHSQLIITVPGAVLPQETLDAFQSPKRGPEITEIR
jgi:hypothetical protein